MAALPNCTPLVSSSKNTALGISVLSASTGASAALVPRATPMAEFDVPKSSPQAIILSPQRCEGALIYCDTPNVARLFLFAYRRPVRRLSKSGRPFLLAAVAPTEAERSEAKRRDLASTIWRQFVERRSLDFASLRSG